MKNFFLGLFLFCFCGINAQNITLRNVPEKYYSVKNIKLTCDNPNFYPIFLLELQKKYSVNADGSKPDLDVKIITKLTNFRSTVREEKEIHVTQYNSKNQYAGEFTRTVKGIYGHSQLLEFNVFVGSEIYPGPRSYYQVSLGYTENKDKTLSQYEILEFDKQSVANVFASCPIMYTTTTYKANSDNLLKAITDYNIDDVIAQGQDIDGLFGSSQKTLLMLCIENNNKILFEKLLKHKPNFEIMDSEGLTAYMYAKIYLRQDMAKRLADLGANTNTIDQSGNNVEDLAIRKNGKNLLINSIYNKDFEMTKNLIGKGIIIEQDKSAYLGTAIMTDNIPMLELIVSAGIPLETKSGVAVNSASYTAGFYKSFTILEYLLNKGIVISAISSEYAWITDLYDVAFNRKNYKMVLQVLQSVNMYEPDFTMLLIRIIENKDYAFIDQLIAAKINNKFSLWKLQKPLASLPLEPAKKIITNFQFVPEKQTFFLSDIIDLARNQGNIELYNWFLTNDGFDALTKYNTAQEKASMWLMYEQKMCLDVDPQKSIAAFEKNPQFINNLSELFIIPLFYFVGQNNEVMVDYLSNKGANVNAYTTVKRKVNYSTYWCPAFSILDTALVIGNKDIIELLKAKGATSWFDNKHNLFVELFFKDFNKLNELIDKFKLTDFVATDSIIIYSENFTTKQIVSVPGTSFFNSLMNNYRLSDYMKLINKLINNGHKINDNPQNPFLNQLTYCTDYGFVERLIELGALVDHPSFAQKGELSPLFVLNYAYLDYKMTELLLKKGAKLNVVLSNKNGIELRKYLENEAKSKKDKKFLELIKQY